MELFGHFLHLKGWAASLVCVPLLFAVSYASLFLFEQPARRWISAFGQSRRQPPDIVVTPTAIEEPLN